MVNITQRTPDDILRRITGYRPRTAEAIAWGVLGSVALLLLYPLMVMLLRSFVTSVPSASPIELGLDNWRAIFTEPRIVAALRNTATVALTRQAIALALGLAIAWGIARTNLPGKRWLELGFWMALFVPTLTATLGWIIMFDGAQGFVNSVLVDWIWFIREPVFEIFSWWGIVFVHLVTGTLAINVLLLTPAIRNVDAALEDASRALGASAFTTFRRVIAPRMLASVALVMLLGIIRSFDAFEIELVLGARDGIDILSTVIFNDVVSDSPRYGAATALAITLLVALVPLIALQQWIASRRPRNGRWGEAVVRLRDLGRWKWPSFAAISALLLLIALPIVAVGVGTLASGPTWAWSESLTDATLWEALKNTLVIGVASAVIAVIAFTLIAYVTVRTPFAGRRALGFLTGFPSVIPGIALSLGFLWFFLQVGMFRGSVWPLIIVVALAGMSFGVQIMKARIAQLGAGMDEVSMALGASRLHTFRRIALPLIAPALLVVGLLTFVSAIRATSVIALLATDESQPLSLLQLDRMVAGEFGEAAIAGMLLVGLIVGAAVVGKLFGLKMGRNDA